MLDQSDIDENVELEEASTAVQNIVNGVEGENSLQNTGWIPCDDLYTVEINDVESFLFEKLKTEINLLNKKLLQKMRNVFGPTLKSADVTKEHIAAVFLPAILSILLKRANKHRLIGMRFRMEEAFAFLCDTCYLAYYKTSPDQYFTCNPRPRFFKPPFSLSYKQYWVFLNALKSKETISAFEPGDEVHIGEFYVNSWDAPLAPNQHLSTAFKEIRQFVHP